MPIPYGYVLNHCRLGQGEQCCRYLAADQDGWCCVKRYLALKQIIDERCREGTVVAQDDNCPGWPEQ